MKRCAKCGVDYETVKCRVCEATRLRTWRAEHAERAREIAREGQVAWRARNPGVAAERAREYRESHREAVRAAGVRKARREAVGRELLRVLGGDPETAVERLRGLLPTSSR